MEADDGVLVALVNQPRDLEIVRAERWYRIPAKYAPTHLTQVRYLAFYLPRAFGECKWTIREYAPVRGHELVRRRDLFPAESDHPRADDAYYKLQLGQLIALPRPIISPRGRRMLFIWTTGDKFSRAVELNDLLGANAADDALWRALQDARIGGERQIVVRDARTRYRVDFWIPCLRGDVVIALGGPARKLPKTNQWRALRFSTTEIELCAANCVRQIKRVVRELGGAKYTFAERQT
ncbi:MAG: hypothetical protein HY868_21890 [Chloroflexi bacterium]|nr:hypothetical protein [Chloroflexota bacterium]